MNCAFITSYERDNETDLNFAQARYQSSSAGRFTTPDPYKIVAEVQTERNAEKARSMLIRFISQPQQWNTYSYTVNNPLKYIDPSGESIIIHGTPEEQRAAIARLREILGEERWSLISSNSGSSTALGDCQVFYISDENVAKFSNIGNDAENKEYSAGMGEILNSKEKNVEFRLTETFTNKRGFKIDLNTETYSGGATVSGEDSTTGNIQIYVSPRAGAIATEVARTKGGLKELMDGKNDFVATTNEVVAHEFGHAFDRLKELNSPAMRSKPSGPGWQVFENTVRGWNGSVRRSKH